MSDFRYYLSIFLRRLPLFLVVAGLISGVAIAVALTLPPAYVSQTRLLVESAQIPDRLATSTVQMEPQEQLQIFETRLLTRANLLGIARQLDVLEDQDKMNPDEIVAAMRARTSIRRSSRRDAATLMTISFEAPRAQTAAGVLNEYLTLILQENAEFRTRRAAQTQQFFQQEVARLNEELDAQSAQILRFKTENADALPESMEYRRSQQVALREQVAQIDRDVATLRDQRGRLRQIFEATGRIEGLDGTGQLSPEEQELARLERELADALLVYSEENPRIKLLRGRMEQARRRLLEAQSGAAPETGTDPARSMFDLQMAEIDARIETLQARKTDLEAELAELAESIARTPANAITLEALERDYANIRDQYNTAVGRLATASTGERIENLSRGQRVTVIEQPAVPSEPTRPNRVKLAGMGVGLGLGAGIALIVLMELLNSTARRPADLVNRLGITPLATIPYMRTRGQRGRRRALMVVTVLAILAAIPAAIYAVHTYYLPLDLIAERVMNKLGVRG
ncbi:polysaccharide chain length determinant protein (PEP-CTERM system associated) [Rhodovulum iodosum]|uniref:Polysaccharide chain length determinant protein (PEP-CTERM system associated) n=1 Tax=Rhodovulum iodosum TaxID=68291 RepID=A0ABV3XYW1_9RHOB|nr:lipopolysaccharide biosynthesis protein [Rhodovulum robiginosum]RSK38867.1 lipopolysaccharide biosynthesis protein [Rhodovulum robiginosum]